MKIIVTGSLGHISRPLAAALIEKGHTVTIISSNPTRKPDIEETGAAAAIGSVLEEEFLVSVFTGADAVYAMIPPNYGAPDAREYYRTLARCYRNAVSKTGIRRVVHLSSIGADLDSGTGFILGSHDSENILNTLTGTAVTHLRPGYFYYNLANFTGMIKGLGFIGSNYGGEDRIVMVSPKDIAVAAAQELTSVTGPKVRYIASDDRTGNDVANVLGAAIGKPDLRWHTSTNEQARQAMESAGMPSHVVANFVEMGDSIHTGRLYNDFNKQEPIEFGKVKLEEYAKEFAEDFRR